MVEELLKTNKHNIVVLDNLQKGHREAVLGGTFIEGGDLADADLLNGIFAEYGIEAVVHLAATAW